MPKRIYSRLESSEQWRAAPSPSLRAYRELSRTQVTPRQSYYSMRSLYCLTNDRFNDGASTIPSSVTIMNLAPQSVVEIGPRNGWRLHEIAAAFRVSRYSCGTIKPGYSGRDRRVEAIYQPKAQFLNEVLQAWAKMSRG